MYNQISSNKRRTVFLLLGFVIILWGLAYVISKATGEPGLLFIIGLFSLSYALFSYFVGSRMALAINGAKEISKKDNPRLWRIVENLAITEGMPMPKVYVMDDPAPNAFATGRKPDKSVVAATTGLLKIMNDSELEGVMAHELGHIKNYDMRVNTIAFALVGIIAMIGDFFLRISLFGRDRNSNGNQLFMVIAIVAVIVAPIAATLIQLAISRRREFLADATGALTTRYPEGLANALRKIGKYGSATKKQNTATAHMFFANPLSGKVIAGLFSTHPPVEQRVKILLEMKL
ncbi:M48 family metallopeptidase [Candidatus Saccharibacteria bacterium]|nr:M48 family metallopeptidase [Candidatus Saccharibacteria bacterium]